jgi:hypothetical protein
MNGGRVHPFWTASILLASIHKHRPMLQRANQMDREHPARLFRQAPAHVAKANGPRSACCAFSVKHRPMLHQAGYKPAFHLVALNQMDRAALAAPVSPSTSPCCNMLVTNPHAMERGLPIRLLPPAPKGGSTIRAPFGLFQAK